MWLVSEAGNCGLVEILPPRAAGVELWDDGSGPDPAGTLIGSEREAVADAVTGRRREFAQGRMCARAALAKLGVDPVEIPVAADRAPCWPAGVVGSVTHKSAFRAAAVARSHDLMGLGIDAERAQPLRAGVLATVALPGELEMVSSLTREQPEVPWDALLFSAKEAAYKALPAATRCGISLGGVRVWLTAQPKELLARLAGDAEQVRVTGRWTVCRGLLLTTAACSCPEQAHTDA